jgi:hypothetical protein
LIEECKKCKANVKFVEESELKWMNILK